MATCHLLHSIGNASDQIIFFFDHHVSLLLIYLLSDSENVRARYMAAIFKVFANIMQLLLFMKLHFFFPCRH